MYNRNRKQNTHTSLITRILIRNQYFVIFFFISILPLALKVDEKIRHKMFTLRQTWNEVFPPQKLYTLDVKVNHMDPGWPVTNKLSAKTPAIHVNPNFFKTQVNTQEVNIVKVLIQRPINSIEVH